MDPECRIITNELIPGVRACLAKQMMRRYGVTQQEIAKKLGIAQVAVSKYMNMKYSEPVARAVRKASRSISKSGLMQEIIRSKNPDEANRKIERFCEKQAYA